MLQTTRTVIVDEIHAIADDKRGSHLALTLARLDALTVRSTASRNASGSRPPCGPSKKWRAISAPGTRIVDAGHRRDDGSGGRSAATTNSAPSPRSEMWAEIYDRVARHYPRASHDAGVRQHAPAVASASRMRLAERLGRRTPFCPITAASRAALRHDAESAPEELANCGRSWLRHRSNWASISAPWIW